MKLKSKVAIAYLLPLLVAYVGTVSAISAGSRPAWTGLIAAALPASALLIFCQLLQDVLPKSIKEALVFYRLIDRLPGSRAFSVICTGDPRVPPQFLTEQLQKTGGAPTAQNASWYAMYRRTAKEASVEHENFRYLAWRDATATLLLLAVFAPVLKTVNIISWLQVGWVAFGCFMLSLATAAAGRNAAFSLVRNVVAIEASGSDASAME